MNSPDELKKIAMHKYVADAFRKLGVPETSMNDKANENLRQVFEKLASDNYDLKQECQRQGEIAGRNEKAAKVLDNIQSLNGQSALERYMQAKRMVIVPVNSTDEILAIQIEVFEFIVEKTLGKPFIEVLSDIEKAKTAKKTGK